MFLRLVAVALITALALGVGVVAFVVLRLCFVALRFRLSSHKYKHIPKHPFYPWTLLKMGDDIDEVLRLCGDENGVRPPLLDLGFVTDGTHWIIAQHCDAIRDIISHEEKFPKHSTYVSVSRDLVGDGLVVNEGSKWKYHRRLLTPLFHFGRLDEYTAQMSQTALRFAHELRDGRLVDPGEETARLTMSVIVDLAFGGSLDPELIRQKFSQMEQIFISRHVPGLVFFGPIWRKLTFLPPVRMLLNSQREIKEMIYGVIAQRRAGKNMGRGEKDIVGLLMRAGDVSDEEIAEEAITFLLAGHDTTALSVAWALYYTAIHPEHQKRLHEEIDAVCAQANVTSIDALAWTTDVLSQLSFTKMIIREALRIRGIAFSFERVALEDSIVSGIKVPKGTAIGMSFMSAHQNALTWPEPTKFDPERFAGEINTKTDPYRFTPFSAGQRNCIGQRFAMMEAQIMIATTAARLHWQYESNGKPVCGKVTALYHPHNVRLRFTPRHDAL